MARRLGRTLGWPTMILVFLSLMTPKAFAADQTHAHGGGSAFTVGAINEVNGHEDVQQVGANQVSGHYEEEPACGQRGLQTCGEFAFCDDGSIQMNVLFVPDGGAPYVVGTSCPAEGGAASPPQVTPGLVLTALRRIGLPESDLKVQPPGGRTLVNFDTSI